MRPVFVFLADSLLFQYTRRDNQLLILGVEDWSLPSHYTSKQSNCMYILWAITLRMGPVHAGTACLITEYTGIYNGSNKNDLSEVGTIIGRRLDKGNTHSIVKVEAGRST